jgi:hypothetical protein
MRASAGVRLKATDAPAARDGRIAVVAPAIRTVRLRLQSRNCTRRCIANSITLIGVAAAAEDSLIG